MERCVARVANQLDRQQFKVSIVCLDRAGSAVAWLERNDIALVELGKGKGNSLKVIPSLARFLRDAKVDVVQSHNWGTLLETTLAAKFARTPAHIHAERGSLLGSDKPSGLKRWVRGIVMRWAVKGTQGLMTNAFLVSQKMASLCRIKPDRIRVIPNGVDAGIDEAERAKARFNIRQQLGLDEDQFLLGSAGRLVSVKNFELAIDLIAKLETEGANNVHLLLVGDGPELDRLTQQVHSKGLRQKVHFVGRQANVWQYLAAMDVYINCSVSEGMSQSILEAMAVGLPIVASDVGDSARLICANLQCGLVFQSQKLEAFKECIFQVYGSASVRQQLAENSKLKNRESYSQFAMISSFEAMYLELGAT
jgi:glycosyltransferase involved in cell wall biosynthesis